MFKLLFKIKPKIFFLGLFLLSTTTYLLGVKHVGFAIWGDSHYYYAYTRSIMMDHDINFTDEAKQKKYPFPNGLQIVKETGYAVSNFSPGVGFLWLPGFAVGQLLALVFNWLGWLVPLDGYSLVTQLTVGISTVAMSVTGLNLLFSSLKLLFNRLVAFITVLSLFLTTQIFYYTSIDPMNSHSAEFLFASLCLWLVLKIKLKQLVGQRWLVILGLSLGMLSIIRNQDFLIALAIVIFSLSDDFKFKKFFLFFKKLWSIGFPMIIVISTQLIFTWIIYHQFGSPYLINGASFDWLHPAILTTILSQGNGFFRYAPSGLVALIGLIGCYFTAKWSVNGQLVKQLSLLAFLVFMSQLYIIASWPAEIIGGPYGSRMFIGTLPFLSFGLAWWIQWLLEKKNRWRMSVIVLTISLFGWNLWQIYWMLVKW